MGQQSKSQKLSMEPFRETGRTLCVIVHFGSTLDTQRAAHSVEGEGVDITVVDNDPARRLTSSPGLPSGAVVIVASAALGFAAANNLGVRHSIKPQHDSILLLNNDATLSQADLMRMRETFLKEPTAGIVGPVVRFHEHGSSVWAAGGTISFLGLSIRGRRFVTSNELERVDYVPGAVMLTRADLWLALGGLPERYFLAYEEASFALRARRKGVRCFVNQFACATHRVGMSSNLAPKYFYNKVRNRLQFGVEFWGILGFFLAVFNGLVRSTKHPVRLKLFLLALSDHHSGNAVSANRLSQIEARFGRDSI